MSTLDRLIRLSARASIILGALFLVSVLLAAMPRHHTPAVQPQGPPQPPAPQQQKSQVMAPNMPGIFAWMVHVYRYEDSIDKVFAMHHHD